MGLKDDLDRFAKETFGDQWTIRDGRKVPETSDLSLANDAVALEGTVLYADLADSTGMVRRKKPHFAAEVYKTYLYCAAKVIRAHDGVITAYDGDRVMAVFLGGSKNTNAANCALRINYAAVKVVQPALEAQYPKSDFVIKQKVGIDTSSLFVARTGIRGSNDLVWVGRAANYAAKLAALPTTYSSYISADVYRLMNESTRLAKDGRQMWTALGSSAIGVEIYGSTFWRSF